MPASLPRLMLHCDAVNSRFTLAQEGDEWRRSFDTFDAAYQHAGTRALDTTTLVLYNELGRKILETTVSPTGAFRSADRRSERATRVLIVDDDVLSSLTLHTILEKLGYIVEEEPDSTRAMAAIRRFKPHILLLDLITEITGDITDQIIRDSSLKDTRLIVCGAIKPAALPGRLSLSGIPHLEKPIKVAALLELLR